MTDHRVGIAGKTSVEARLVAGFGFRPAKARLISIID